MNKHVLVTISDEPSCFYGVRFVGNFFENKDNFHITLLYVAPPQPKGIEAVNGVEAQKMAFDLLELLGFPRKNINTKILERKFGTVKDIINEGRKGLYDAVILGRRGYLAFESLLGTSTSREIMESRIDFPIWICRHGDYTKKHILVATDGSEASLRIADHVGFMIKDEKHIVTVCHVGEDFHEARQFVEETVNAIVVNGVSTDRIRTEIIVDRRPVDVVLLDKMQAQNINVLAVGRSKAKEGTIKGWFSGSCSSKLLSKMEVGSLWVSR